jgi:hypothetical protein
MTHLRISAASAAPPAIYRLEPLVVGYAQGPAAHPLRIGPGYRFEETGLDQLFEMSA